MQIMPIQTITGKDIYNSNMHSLYMEIYKGRQYVLQPEMTYNVKLSRPTVTTHLATMEEAGLISRNKVFFYSYREKLGRRPILWSITYDYRIALGVEMSEHYVDITAINLYGEAMKSERFTAEYENNGKYYNYVVENVKEFISSLDLKDSDKKILGIGFTLQGLISEKNGTMICGKSLKHTGLSIDVFSERLNWPCNFIYTPNCAALAEVWLSPELESIFYISIEEHLSGAFVEADGINDSVRVVHSKFEHITACPGGELCYCGKNGCFETVCSKTALLKGDKPDEFFARVREGEPEASKRWRVFLEYLGRLIAHLHLLYDTKYILGGHLAPYFTDDDIKFLYERVRERTPFEEDDDYILPSKMPSHNITVGAALPYIMRFLEHAPEI